MKKSIFAILIFTITSVANAGLINLTVLLDSSGSVRNERGSPEEFDNWFDELNAAKTLADLHPTHDDYGSFSLINFAGCTNSYSYEECSEPASGANQRIRLEASNLDNAADFSQAIDALDETNFIGGRTWTNSALKMALANLQPSVPEEKKVFVMFTDGKPYPEAHSPCNVQGYVSPELQAIREQNIELMVVGIKLDQSAIDNFFGCITTPDNFFAIDSFDVGEFGNFFDSYQAKFLTNPPSEDIPEPSTIAMFLLAILGLSLRNRSKS